MSLFTSLLPTFTHSRMAGTAAPSDDVTLSRRPAYAISETEENYTLTVDLPGVTKENLTVTAENGVLTVTGTRTWRQPEGWTPLHLESTDTGYSLALSYKDAIDADKISAAFADGVLRLTLPKSESRKPRKIAVT